MKKKTLYILLSLVLSLTGCSNIVIDFESISVEDAQSPDPAFDLVVSTPEETIQANPSTLLAPLYFINAADEQIWSIEEDGLTLTQITMEDSPVTEFDVSPKDGALVYVSGNGLFYYSPALGGVRQELQPADPYDPGDYIAQLTRAIRNPQWSPDGDWILYQHSDPALFLDPGMPRQEGVPEVFSLSLSDPLPDPLPAEGETYDGPQTMYAPINWSPDGKHILLDGSYYFALGNFKALFNREDESLVELPVFSGAPCCTLAWARDGQHIYLAGNLPGMYPLGLRRFDPFAGESLQLVPGEAFEQYHLFAYPFEQSDGAVYGFYASVPANPDVMPYPTLPLRMVSVANDGSGELVDLRTDYYTLGEAAWTPDGSGAAITDTGGSQATGWPPVGTLRWLPSDGSAMIELPAVGRALHWGLPWGR